MDLIGVVYLFTIKTILFSYNGPNIDIPHIHCYIKVINIMDLRHSSLLFTVIVPRRKIYLMDLRLLLQLFTVILLRDK